ncbi:MAG: hypothetical protein FH758_12595 [Firmicutes bacterium]|nr:hypothetical protein [Bacillota bacterium]
MKNLASENMAVLVPHFINHKKINLLLENDFEFRHQILKIYDVRTQIQLCTHAHNGLALINGELIQEIYYICMNDRLMRCETIEKSFENIYQDHEIKKGMLLNSTAAIPEEQIMNSLIKNKFLWQSILISIELDICTEEILSPSQLNYETNSLQTIDANIQSKKKLSEYLKMLQKIKKED